MGQLIEVADDDEELWPFTPALRRAAALGVPFNQGHLRPFDAKKIEECWLSFWHHCAEPVRWLNDPLMEASGGSGSVQVPPKLAVATLLRGVPAAVVQSFAMLGPVWIIKALDSLRVQDHSESWTMIGYDWI